VKEEERGRWGKEKNIITPHKVKEVHVCMLQRIIAEYLPERGGVQEQESMGGGGGGGGAAKGRGTARSYGKRGKGKRNNRYSKRRKSIITTNCRNKKKDPCGPLRLLRVRRRERKKGRVPKVSCSGKWEKIHPKEQRRLASKIDLLLKVIVFWFRGKNLRKRTASKGREEKTAQALGLLGVGACKRSCPPEFASQEKLIAGKILRREKSILYREWT